MNCLHFRTVSKRNSSPHHNSHCCRTHRWREKLLAGPHRAPLAPLQTCSFSAKPAHTWLGLQDRHHIWECQNTITDSSTEFPISWQRYIGSKCELSHSFSASTFLMFMVKTAPTWQEVAYQNSTLARQYVLLDTLVTFQRVWLWRTKQWQVTCFSEQTACACLKMRSPYNLLKRRAEVCTAGHQCIYTM